MIKPSQKEIIIVAGLVSFLLVCIGFLLLPSLAYCGPSKRFITLRRAEELYSGLETYKNNFGNFPVGDNATIMKMLCRDNPKGKQLFHFTDRSRAHAKDWRGQCVDGWGTAFQIDFSPTNNLVILSAGIDKAFGSKDDLIFNGSTNDFVKP